MLLRRVLVTTALVAILASSLFSGWLGSSLVAQTPVARAADPEATCTEYKKDVIAPTYVGSASYIRAEPWDAFGRVGNNLHIGIQQLVKNSLFNGLNPGLGYLNTGIIITIYRNPANGEGDIVTTLLNDADGLTYRTTGNLYESPLISPPRLSDDTFGDDNATNSTKRNETRYFALITANKSNQGAQELQKSFNYCLSASSSSSSTIDRGKVVSWFNENLGPYKYLPANFSETAANAPPYFIIPKSATTGRPEITFKLLDVSGGDKPGLGEYSFVKYWSFQGYRTGLNIKDGEELVKIPDLVFMIDSGDNVGDVYWMNGVDIRPLLGTDELKKVHQIKAGIGIEDTSWRLLAAYSMVSPIIRRDGTTTDCQKDPAKFKFTGPDWKDDTTGTIAEKSADDPMGLNPYCLNKTGDPKIEKIKGGSSWLVFWGVGQTQQATSSSKDPCNGGNIFGSLTGDGLGATVLKVFACIIGYVIDKIYTPLATTTQGAGDQIGALESNLAGTGPNKGFLGAWKFSLGLINIVVVLALLAIAFANILHLNINTYTAKKALPGLVMGVVGANASLLLIRFVLDVARSLETFAFNIANTPKFPVHTAGDFVAAFMTKIGGTAFHNSAINWIAILVSPLAFFVILIFAIFFFYLLFVFAWAMIKRLVYIYALTVVAPLAFVAYGVPGQQQWFTKWWDMMLRQIFMLPVVFLAMALLIRYVDASIDIGRIQALDVSELINMAIIFLAALFILKLPGLITKGAIDITNAAKKAFGMAKATPLKAMQAGQWAHGKYSSGKINKAIAADRSAVANKARQMRAAGDREGAKKLIADYRASATKRYKEISKPYTDGKVSKLLAGGRGFSTLLDRPALLKEAWDARQELIKKSDYIAAMTKTTLPSWLGGGTVPGRLRGIDAEADLQKKLGMDELKDARTPGDFIAWRETLGKGHLGRVESRLARAIARAANNDPGEIERLTQAGGSITKDSYKDFIRSLQNEGGLKFDVNNIKEVSDLMKWAALMTSEARAARSIRDTEENEHPNIKASRKRALIRGQTPPGGGANPSGGPNPPNTPPGGGGGGSPSGGPGGGNGGAPGGKVQKVFVTNPVQIQNPQNEAMFNKLAEHAQTLMDTVGSEKLSAHAVASGGDVSKLLSGDVGEAIKGQIGHLMNEGGGKLIHELISAAVNGGDVSALRALVARGEIIDRTGQEMTNEAAGFSDEQLDRFAEKVGTSTSEAVQSLGGVLAPHFKSMGITDPKIIAAYSQKLIDGIQSSINKGPKSLRAEMVNQFGRLAKTVAQEQGLAHIDNASLASTIAQAEASRPSAPPTSTTNVTNVSNVEQTTTAESAPPAPADDSGAPTDLTPRTSQ